MYINKKSTKKITLCSIGLYLNMCSSFSVLKNLL